MKSVPLNVFPRTAVRWTGVKKLRAAKRIPAVIYGRRRSAPQNLEIESEAFRNLLRHSASENLLLDLTVQGDAEAHRLALLQEVQHHPLTDRVLHVDFHEVAEDERVTVMVPVEATGEPLGVKSGGVLEHVRFRLKVRALPRDLPEALVVDVAHLDIGQAVHIGEIVPPTGVEILGDKHISVLAVAAPVTEAEEAAATATAEGTTIEPEVIKEKKDEDAAEGEKPAGDKGAAKAGAKPAAGAPAEKAGEKKPEKKAEKK